MLTSTLGIDPWVLTGKTRPDDPVVARDRRHLLAAREAAGRTSRLDDLSRTVAWAAALLGRVRPSPVPCCAA